MKRDRMWKRITCNQPVGWLHNKIGTLGFFLMGFAIFLGIRGIFGVSNEYSEHAEMMIEGYYEEQENTLDAVFIGNSHIYRYWQSAFAWEEYGIASSALSVSAMPGSTMKNVAIEALKTQKPKVLVLDATAFARKDNAEKKVYLLLDNMKFSFNYIDMVENYCESAGVTGMDKLQYYIPIIQFHSRWKELGKADFVRTYPSYLNSCYMESFLTSTIKEREHRATEVRTEIGTNNEADLRDLLEWCTEQEVKVLFLAVPMLRSEEKLGMINRVEDIVKEYGVDFIDYNEVELYESFDFQVTQDFQDTNHTNINGSYKFTKVFGKYLEEQYGLMDHRGETLYASWDEKAREYEELIQEYFIYPREVID